MNKLFGVGAVAAAVLLCSVSAHAGLITAPVNAFIEFPTLNYFGSGPITFGPGIIWSNTNIAPYGSSFGYNGLYGFGFNGDNSNGSGGYHKVTALSNGSELCFEVPGFCDPPDAVENHITSMTFAFANPVSSVGGFMNWVQSTLPVTISIYDSGWSLLDSLTVSEGGVNLVSPDSFYGFQDATSDISYFVLKDGYIGIYDGLNGTAIGVSDLKVPEPLTSSIFGAGLVGAAILRRRRKTKTSRPA